MHCLARWVRKALAAGLWPSHQTLVLKVHSYLSLVERRTVLSHKTQSIYWREHSLRALFVEPCGSTRAQLREDYSVIPVIPSACCRFPPSSDASRRHLLVSRMLHPPRIKSEHPRMAAMDHEQTPSTLPSRVQSSFTFLFKSGKYST